MSKLPLKVTKRSGGAPAESPRATGDMQTYRFLPLSQREGVGAAYPEKPLRCAHRRMPDKKTNLPGKFADDPEGGGNKHKTAGLKTCRYLSAGAWLARVACRLGRQSVAAANQQGKAEQRPAKAPK